ncbi:hypothetical protein [Amycolatopsis albispora]|uniref:Uncharacterized protein n=1 Tax=Amycolatopsis albispora TaxID=1804986 RepID=A0A344L1B8_9PSEU|nr:hypothetical protein [Amycolatopsis albispora]AXB41842.1 hypothetical protein A4R43_04285 [Amycolatopsis albispora]
MTTSRRGRTIEGAQTLVIIVAIPLGLIPLIRWILSEDHGGLFRWFFGSLSGVLGYAAPIIVLAVAFLLVMLLEAVKKKGA